MYSEIVISKTVRDFEIRNGWRPEFHSVGECDHMAEEIAADWQRLQAATTSLKP